MTQIFKFKDHIYDLKTNNCIEKRIIKQCKSGGETVSNLEAKRWDILQEKFLKVEFLQGFKNEIKFALR